MADPPPPPPGFTVDKPGSAPPPPPGFTVDQTDPLIRDLKDPSWYGTIPRFAAGVAQGGGLDPVEKVGELTGIGQNPPKWLEDRLAAVREAAGKTTPGEFGRVAGAFANPLWRLLPAVPMAKYAPPVMHALAKLATSAYQGALGGAAQPTGAKTPSEALKQTATPAREGGELGAVLGLPGALIAKFGYENLQQPIREVIRDLPLEFRRIGQLRNLTVPTFTRWWHEQSVAPINGKVPGKLNKATFDDIGKQIGTALDKSTANMTFDATNPTVRQALNKTRADSAVNLATSGGALRAYNSVVNRLWNSPLAVSGNKLTSQQLQQISSNLEAHIRLIDPSVSPDNALLKRELENFRMSVLDNATGTAAEKAAYAQARQAWRIHATGRDSQPLGEPHGHINPDLLAKELNRRDPLRFPYGGGRRGFPDPLQSGVQHAQQALFNMSGAARRGQRGVPLAQPEDYAFPVGTAAPSAFSLLGLSPDQEQTP